MGFVFCDSYYPTDKGGGQQGGPARARGGHGRGRTGRSGGHGRPGKGKLDGCIMHQVHTSFFERFKKLLYNIQYIFRYFYFFNMTLF